ncbi:catalase family peroxidase [Rugamonas sp.]|uniref:catalase family peroxidase n=1 Tax=Rugamonas sp. TaxID=1926287 RepID=UPI0025FBCA78|nr:catalase family peroxidase [Rugamonas sp.]
MKKFIHFSTLALVPIGMMAVSTLSLAQVTTPQPELKTTPTEMVDTLNTVFGPHKERAIHAKGILLEGTFTPAPTAASISMAPHLQKKSVPVIVRFSNFAGVPDIPDNHPLASPRGMAIRFKLPDGSNSDMVVHSFNGFPSANADQFRELLQALAASGPDAAKPTALDNYLGTHPIAKNFLTAAKPAPVSYGSLPYFGVNAFKFTNAAGKVTYGRYRIVPLAPAAYLNDAQTKAAAPAYLGEEITAHVAKQAVKFKLLVQVAAKEDKVDDPSVAWPDSRHTVELGTISIDKVAPDMAAAQKAIVFMPNALPKGIEVEDQMVNFRSNAYAVSFGRRQ